MSREDFAAALEAIDEPASCTGTYPLDERLAIMLPDGDVAALGDPQFVDWLVEHGEPAPFGLGAETKLDPNVRHATRLRARGAAIVSGFDPASLLPDIEAALSPRAHLAATLTDVIVYPVRGHFAKHRDTPTSVDLVGTLVVGLPIPHAGGAFTVEDRVVDWSGPVDPHALRWVALFSDAEHAIAEVTSGARVTLVYSLTRTTARRDPDDRRFQHLHSAATTLPLPDGPLMIACTRLVIGVDNPQPQSIDVLRGTDRDVADVLVRCGFRVVVRTCLVAQSTEFDPTPRFRATLNHDFDEITFARLAKPLFDRDVEHDDCVTFQRPNGDGGGYLDEDVHDLTPYVAGTVPLEDWIIRKRAAATLMRAIDFANDGFVGNGAEEAFLYKLAALEVTR